MAGNLSSFNSVMSDQNNKAFELKLMNAKLEQEHQNRLGEAQQAQSAELARFAREHSVSPGVSKAAAGVIGSDIGPMTTNDEPTVDALIKNKQMMGMKETKVDPQYDEVGIHATDLKSNGLGFPMGSPTPAVNYQKNRETYDKLITYNTLLTQSQQLYNDLKVHNALGTGSMFNKLPENLIQERTVLLDNAKKLGPLSAGTIEGIPGGRYVQALSDSLSSGQPLPQKDEQVFSDEMNTAKLMIYSKIRNISSRATMPQDLTNKFAGLLHDQNGEIVNPSDISIVNSKIYYGGNPSPVGDLGSPFLAVHPAAASSFANHVAGKTAQAQGSPFGDDAAFNAALQSVRGQK